LYAASNGGDNDNGSLPPKPLPKVIVFDLDGCLWTPEMYEIVYFMGGQGAPFREDPNHPSNLLTCGNRPVQLLGDVRSVFEEIYRQPWSKSVSIGISSRTDEPSWARELLEKFRITTNDDGKPISLIDVLNGPIEIAKDSKVSHFERIRARTGVPYEEMVFFDNEFGNCERVASLGVTVVYCPDGVTSELWESGIFDNFPRSDGSVVNSNRRGWF
jgi:magnesium-dependent phosphatase 1